MLVTKQLIVAIVFIYVNRDQKLFGYVHSSK